LAERLAVSYPTAKNDIDRLVEVGVLQEIAETRPRAYFAPKIMKAAYGELED
jgi:Fic family protein